MKRTLHRSYYKAPAWISLSLGFIAFPPAMQTLFASNNYPAAREYGVQGPTAAFRVIGFSLTAEESLLLFEFADATAWQSTGTTILSVSVVSGASNSIAVEPGALVEYQVVGLLSDDDNQGLALVGFDLDFDGGELTQADSPTGDPDSGCENPMIHFTKPWGITNPAGFGGTIILGDLIQVGGAQNTINNTPDIAPFPIGTVLLGVAQPSGCGPAVLVSGSVTAPIAPGLYTLALENLFANIITTDATGDPFWQTQSAGVGAVENLTILVEIPTSSGACCQHIDGGCEQMTELTCREAGGSYRGDDSTCGEDADGDGVRLPCDLCPNSRPSVKVDASGCPIRAWLPVDRAPPK